MSVRRWVIADPERGCRDVAASIGWLRVRSTPLPRRTPAARSWRAGPGLARAQPGRAARAASSRSQTSRTAPAPPGRRVRQRCGVRDRAMAVGHGDWQRHARASPAGPARRRRHRPPRSRGIPVRREQFVERCRFVIAAEHDMADAEFGHAPGGRAASRARR